MRRCSCTAVVIGIVVCTLGTAAAQTPREPTPSAFDRTASAELAQQVRSEFGHAWNGYKQYAWGHDELLPLSRGYRDWYGSSLLMTPVDALDTMLLMGLTQEAG